MKALITGGYGFIGSHVADRFFKEGYEVFIIDNLSTGERENISFKHKGYQLSVEDPKCEEIFRSNQFDVLIHLAAQVNVEDSIRSPRHDAKSNVLGLVNMLTLAKKYKLKKFLFASSAEVYGENDHLPLTETETCNPVSPYGISKWVGESYCLKWNSLYELDTMCFRFSNVYGPRQGSLSEGGVVSAFMNQALRNQPLIVHGDGKQTRDFIYVEDVADALFRASYTKLSGIYNLSTNTSCSINSLARILQGLDHSIKVIHSENRDGDIHHSILCNEKIKNEMDWSPLYGVNEGLRRTYSWAKANKKVPNNVPEKKENNPLFRLYSKKIRPYVENLLLFSIISWIILANQNSIYQTVDVGMFYIMIIGLMYGNRQALIAVVLAIFLLIYERLSEGREMLSLLYDTSFFFQIAIYLFIGLVVGYSFQRKKNAMSEQKQRIKELEEQYGFLNKVNKEVREVKDELQYRILNSVDSFGKIHSVLKELEGLEPEKVFTSTVNVVQNMMKVQNVSIYMLNKNSSFLRLIAKVNGSGAPIKNSIIVNDSTFIQHILRDGKIFVNKNLNSEEPIMAAPIFHRNKIVAIIMIDGMKFENFSLYHENLFSITTEMVGSALSRSWNYIDAIKSNRYVPNTLILKRNVFQDILLSKEVAKEKHKTPYLLLECPIKEQTLGEYSKKISSLIRESDYVGQYDAKTIVVLLSNTSENREMYVLSRYERHGVPMKKFEGVF